MILLNSTSDLIQLITGGTQVVTVHVSWLDMPGSPTTPGRLNSSWNSAATNTIVASPASGVSRNVKFISITNTDASVSINISVQHTDGSTVAVLRQTFALLAGYSLQYNDLSGWVLMNASGGLVESPVTGSGSYLGTTQVSSASANFTTQAATTKIRIRGVGGGGGGAGCTSVVSDAAAGGGGGAGGYAEKTFTVAGSTAYAYTCGTAGTHASGAAGGNGGNSTFVVGATTVTAFGGSGAPLATAVATLVAYAGGAGGAVSTNGDINAGGQPGGYGVVLITATPIIASGHGGSGLFGGGGVGLTAVGTGNAATGFGAGGGGSATGASAARAGGAPTAGCWVIDEFS